MKQYPKVPRYDHPTVEPAAHEGDLWLVEKLDGSNFRFVRYDERFADAYAGDVTELDPANGELVFGTRRVVRGTDSTGLDAIDGSLHRAVRALREVDREAIGTLHDEEGGPITFFAENMILHTIDYDYTERPPPALLGFDAYSPARDPTPRETPSDPFEERFEGFLPGEAVFGTSDTDGGSGADGTGDAGGGSGADDAVNGNPDDEFKTEEGDGDPGVFERIGLDTVPVVDRIDIRNRGFDPGSYEVPRSAFADRRAEGVVIRNDAANRRTKSVTEDFQELNRQRWGGREDDAETGAEAFVATFCTNARIRKGVRKMVVEEEYDFSRAIIEELYPRIVEDIWAEEWREIMDLDFAFTPAEVRPLVAQRCAEVVTTMETNARLNDVPPETLWAEE
jgi:hypothetical protein